MPGTGINGKRSFANQKHAILVEVADLEDKREQHPCQARGLLEARVALLRPESIDPDMLEEMARQMLGYVRSNEITVSE